MSNIDNQSVTFVEQDGVVQLPTSMKALDHYWMHMCNWAEPKAGQSITVKEFTSEFYAAEERYFQDLPSVTKMLIDMNVPRDIRYLTVLTHLTK